MRTEWKAGDALPRIILPLTLRRAIQAVAGTRDFYPFHHDEKFARENGARGIFMNTMFLQGFAGRIATDWFGHATFLRRLEVAMRGSNYINSTLTAHGVVTAVRESDGCRLVEVDVIMGTDDGPTTDVKLTVQLPVAIQP